MEDTLHAISRQLVFISALLGAILGVLLVKR